MMKDYFSPLQDDSELRQGDILRKYNKPISREGATWGFVINADCDLANRKNQGHISWLQIIPTKEYWQKFWAPQQLTVFTQTKSHQLREKLNAILKKQGHSFDELSSDRLIDWVHQSGPKNIIASLGAGVQQKLLKELTAFSIAVCEDDDRNSLDVLEECQTYLGQSNDDLTAKFRQFLNRLEGFPDFVLVPNVPDGDAKGYVILLRRINGANETEIFKTERDARLNDRSDALHRVGQFHDSIRFLVVQKMSFLFSRIGASEQFTDECSQVVDLTIDDRRNAI